MLGLYNFLLQAHSGWRWIVLLVVVITIIKVLIGWLAKQQWTKLDTNLMRITNWVVSIQIILGIVLYILVLPQGRPNLLAFTFAHAVPALLALGGVGFASARSKKAPEANQKFKFASIGLIIAAVLIYGALTTVGGIFA